MQEQMAAFIDRHPLHPFCNQLRNMLLHYIKEQSRTGLPADFESFLSAIEDLFSLLDAAAAEQKPLL